MIMGSSVRSAAIIASKSKTSRLSNNTSRLSNQISNGIMVTCSKMHFGDTCNTKTDMSSNLINNIHTKLDRSTDLRFEYEVKLNRFIAFECGSQVKLNRSRLKDEVDLNLPNILNFGALAKNSFTKCPESCITYSRNQDEANTFGTRCEIQKIGVQE